jgi:cytochrome c oxidase assembly protein subunit 15
MPATLWTRRLTLAALVLCFAVVVLGAYVRLSAAGLGCPDWPGCYGHFTPVGAQENTAAQAAYPGRPLDIGKAWREMVHRYAASTLGLIIVIIAALAIATRRQRIVPLGYSFALLGIVVLQGLLGMLTVTWNLKPLIVTLHLLFGLTTLSLLWWSWLSLRNEPGEVRRSGVQKIVLAGLVALAVQIALGGWTSSNYAAVACPDFPTCQNQWWPPTDYRDAFILWRGLGINYEGGVLEHPARVAIHLTHRIGAVVASIALLFAAFAVLKQPSLRHARTAGLAVLGALALQLIIGISMVVKGFPLPVATAHNAGAALLLLATLALYRRVSRFC